MVDEAKEDAKSRVQEAEKETRVIDEECILFKGVKRPRRDPRTMSDQ